LNAALAVIVAVGSVLAASNARASVVLAEPFAYTAGDLNTQGGWSGSTNWDVATTGLLTYPVASGMSATGNQATINGGGGAVTKNLGSSLDFGATGTYYMSFLVRKNQTAQTGNEYLWMVLEDGSAAQKTAIGIGSGENLLLGANTGTFGASANTLSGSTDYLYVAKLVASAGAEQFSVKAYAPSAAGPWTEPTTWDLTQTPTVSGTATRLRIDGGSVGYYTIDEIRLGTTWEDVVSAVPVLTFTWTGAVDGNWDVGATANWVGGATFSNGSFAVFDDTATGTTNVTVAAGGVSPASTTVNNATKPYTFGGGAIGGSGNLTKTGAATLTLSAANTYAGSTIINGGTVVLAGGNDRLPATTALSLANAAGVTLDLNATNQTVKWLEGGGSTGGRVTNTGASRSVLTLNLGASATRTYAGTITGDVQLVVRNSTTKNTDVQILTATNSYTGGTVVDNGFLRVASDAYLGAVPGSFDADNIILKNGGAIQNNNSSLSLHANRGIYLENGNGVLYSGWSHAQGIVVNGAISGPGNLVKTDSGTVILNTANTYTGTTTVSQGPLRIRHVSALGTTSAGTTVSSGGALELDNPGTVAPEPLTLNGTGVSNGGALRSVAGNNTYTSPITLGSAARINADAGTLTLDVAAGNAVSAANQSITFGGAGNITVADPISLGSGGLAKDGAGTLILSRDNAYTGATVISGGTLVATSAGVLGTTAGGTQVAGGTLALQGGITIPAAEAITLGGISGPGTLRNLDGANALGGNLALGGVSATIDSQAGALTIAGSVDMGGSNLIVTGAGNTVIEGAISGVHTASGSTAIPGLVAGTLSGSSMSLAANPGILGVNMMLSPHAGLTNVSPPWAGNTTWVYTGQFYDADGTFSFGENVDDATWIKIDGSVRLNDGSWNTPTTTGILNLGMGPAGDGWHDVEIRFFNGGGGAGAVAGNGWTATKGFGLNAAGTTSTNGADYPDSVTDPGNATLWRNMVLTVASDLVKSGTGTLTLNGDNTYVGTTTVQEGTLLVNGSTSGQGSYTVESGATLGGNGAIGLASGAAVTFQGGAFLSPGTSLGELAVGGDLTLADGSTYVWELGDDGDANLLERGEDYDVMDLTGTLQLGDWTLALVDVGGEARAGDKLYLFTGFTDLEMLGNVTFDLSQAPAWLEFTRPGDLRIDRDSVGLYLSGLQSVPEPSALALAGLSLAGLAIFVRRGRVVARTVSEWVR
jgi:autotransporter-associated beta strand protein